MEGNDSRGTLASVRSRERGPREGGRRTHSGIGAAGGRRSRPELDRVTAEKPPDRERFAAEVKGALRAIDRPDLLLDSPLIASGWVEGKGGTQRVDALLRQLRRACQAVRDEDRDLRGWEALDRTYLRPAVKQLAAADDLGLSFGTYRRALTAAVERVVDRLWAVEAKDARPWVIRRTGRWDPVPRVFRSRVSAGLRQLAVRGVARDPELDADLRRHQDLFARSPRDEEIDRVFRATFFHDGARRSQREVADSLGMPLGSYRRFLSQAVRRVGTVLWFERCERERRP